MHAPVSGFPDSPVSIASPVPASSRFIARFAETADEIEAIKSLRYDVFFRERNLSPEGLSHRDWDRFDPWCRHLVVIDSKNRRVIGTYRILTADDARHTGGFYSETEFDLSSLDEIRSTTVELGRASIHPDYRGGFILALMWNAIFRFLSSGSWRAILGSASIDLSDGGKMARSVHGSLKQSAWEPRFRSSPHVPFPVEPAERTDRNFKPPALLYGYLKLGARAMGPPAYDPVFQTADFPLLLHFDRMNRRFSGRFERNSPV